MALNPAKFLNPAPSDPIGLLMRGANLNSVSSAVEGGRNRLRRKRSPFLPDVGRPLLVHCSHHKVGTVWFMRVLKAVAENYKLHFEIIGRDRPAAETEVFLFNNTFRFKDETVSSFLGGRLFRGSHMIRDPRDLVVSAYHYHLRTSEQWALKPLDKWGGKSYQELLRSKSPHDGLLTEISRCARSDLASMGYWDYEQPEFFELHYEDVLRDETAAFESLFRHYGFRTSDCLASAKTARSFSLDVVRRRQDAHVRSGQPGEWRESFSAEHIAHFKELTGDLLIRLGYETTTDW